MDPQGALVEAAMAGLQELASEGFPSAFAVLDSFQPDVRDRAMCNAIKFGGLKVGLSTVEAVYGVYTVGQAIAVLARGAWVPSGNRNTINLIEGQRLVVGGGFNPSAAAHEINRALQTAGHSRSTFNWDEITREICGLYSFPPVDSVYIDGELDLAKAIAEKSKMALRNPGVMFTISHADSALRELRSSGTSADL